MKYYHVWFQTKFKKYMLIDNIDSEIHGLFKQIAEEKSIKLIAAGSLPDHAHLLIGLEDHQNLSWAVQMLKGISSRRISQGFKMLKQDFRTNNFWARNYGAKAVTESGLAATANYIQKQKKDLHVI
jgi:REP element-mobilizing transposase RayT